MRLKKVVSAQVGTLLVKSVFASHKRDVSPMQSAIDEYVSRPVTMVSYEHTITIQGQVIKFPIRFPIPPAVNSYSDLIEAKIADLVAEFGLYKGLESLVTACSFAFLSGLISPYSSESCQEGLSFYYTTLFDHDDCIDLHNASGEIDPDVLQEVNDRLEFILAGHAATATDLPRVKAIARIYDIYFRPIIEGGAEFEYAQITFHEYLQSTVQEARHIQSEVKILEEVYLEHRQHTGGIRHAFAVMCLSEGVNIACLLKRYINLQFMLRLISDVVGILNDALSFEKELRELMKKNPSVGAHEIELLKAKVTSNLVLIKWRDGMSFADAVAHANDIYQKKLDAFYALKTELEPFFTKDAALRKITFLMEGWLFGHPIWAVNIMRYNRSIKGPLTIAKANDFIRQFVDARRIP